MNFKKDYINYILHKVLQFKTNDAVQFSPMLNDVINKTIAAEDLSKITFLIGKTAGFELLFKYILYISDKIDKSQVSVANLKNNFEYDVETLSKICRQIDSKLTEQKKQLVLEREKEATNIPEKKKEAIKIDLTGETSVPYTGEELAASAEAGEETAEESIMMLVENETENPDNEEVYNLREISETVEKAGETDEELNEAKTELPPFEPVSEKTDLPPEEREPAQKETSHEKFTESAIPEENQLPGIKTVAEESGGELPEIEIEIKESFESETVRPEPLANEVYYRFENKFFEEVKILEKLFSQVGKEYSAGSLNKLGDRVLQVLTQIIEISAELGDLSRQLSLDLTADIFHTINLYFTKAIGSPDIITGDRLKLMDSSLALVVSLIKGKDYLDYDRIVDKIVQLKEQLQKPTEQGMQTLIAEQSREKQLPLKSLSETSEGVTAADDKKTKFTGVLRKQNIQVPTPSVQKPAVDDVVLFKMKYLVKEFEKNFKHLSSLKNEYAKFEALDEIDVLNNSLRLLAKISASVKLYDVCKLAEVSYIFLKYLKDYRIDLLDPEIQQVIKYIIISFKMLLTDKKPDDFDVLVEYLNDPVKIFSDS
jgi:hypothetical protein